MLADLIAENRNLKLDETQHLEDLIKGVHDAISQLQAETKRRNQLTQDKPQAVQGLSSDDTAGLTPSWEDMGKLSSNISRLANEVALSASDQVLLNSLRFDYIGQRQATVEPAHKQTFEWVLDPSSPLKFEHWARFQNGIYWVMGKAGSGKSTIMKFLLDHTKTAEALEAWAGTKELVIASFFFWNAGPSVQRSQEGLFRSLLYEILSQCPDLTRTVCSSKAAKFHPFEREFGPWTLQELEDAIGLLKETSGVRARFCFFVDGLDEYDGKPDQIVSVLESLRSWSDIKLCVSSRPYNEFKDAFGRPSDPQLALEDLTREDIRLYVRNTLEDNSRFKALKARDDRSQDLVQEIVDKAQGVFLWVVLVVRSLLTGLRNADRICDLQKRLREFPETLEKFFGHMIASVEPIYREQTAQAFTYALEAKRPLSLMTYSFLDDEDLDAVVTAPFNALTIQGIQERHDDMRRRLNGRCKGLLEVVNIRRFKGFDTQYEGLFDAPKVVFHHRTVRDFLQTKDMQNMLLENLEAGFEPKLRFCKALLAQLKALDYCAFARDSGLPLDLLEDLAHYAFRLEYENHVQQSSLLDEVGRCVSKQADVFGWMKGERDFLKFLTKRRLHLYITETLKVRTSLTQSDKSYLLGSVLEYSQTMYSPSSFSRDRRGRLDAKIVDVLLEHGAQPNDGYKKSTVWSRFLFLVNRKSYYSSDSDLLPITESLLSHGADLQQRIVTGQRTRNTGMLGTANITKSAQDILLLRFGEEKTSEMIKKARRDKEPDPFRLRLWSGRSLRTYIKTLKR